MVVLRVQAGDDARFVVVRSLSDDRQTVVVRGVDSKGTLTIPLPKAERVIVCVLDRVGRESEAVEAPR